MIINRIEAIVNFFNGDKNLLLTLNLFEGYAQLEKNSIDTREYNDLKLELNLPSYSILFLTWR